MPKDPPRPPTVDPADAAPPLRVVRRRYHLHVPGVVYVLTTFLMSIGAINSQNNLLFWAFGLAVTSLIVSGLLSGSALMGLELTREPIAETAAGEPLLVRYRLRNRNRFVPAFGLTITESHRAPRGQPAPTWPGHAAPPRAFVTELGPRSSVSLEAVATALRRGEATFNAVTISTTFPFGLTRKSITFAGPASAIVRPARLHLRETLLPSLVRRGHDTGSTRAVSPLGEEFFTLREYRPGDATRAVAWRASARAGEWRVRAHSMPGPRRLWIGLTVSAADGDRAEVAISLAAALASSAHRSGFLVGLWFPAAALTLPPRQSTTALPALLNALALAKLAGPDAASLPPGSPDRDSLVLIHAAEAPPAGGSVAHLSISDLAGYLAAGPAETGLPAAEAAA